MTRTRMRLSESSGTKVQITAGGFILPFGSPLSDTEAPPGVSHGSHATMQKQPLVKNTRHCACGTAEAAPRPQAHEFNPSITCSRRPTEAPNYFPLTRLLMLCFCPPHIPPVSHMFTLPAPCSAHACPSIPSYAAPCAATFREPTRLHATPRHTACSGVPRLATPR